MTYEMFIEGKRHVNVTKKQFDSFYEKFLKKYQGYLMKGIPLDPEIAFTVLCQQGRIEKFLSGEVKEEKPVKKEKKNIFSSSKELDEIDGK